MNEKLEHRHRGAAKSPQQAGFTMCFHNPGHSGLPLPHCDSAYGPTQEGIMLVSGGALNAHLCRLYSQESSHSIVWLSLLRSSSHHLQILRPAFQVRKTRKSTEKLSARGTVTNLTGLWKLRRKHWIWLRPVLQSCQAVTVGRIELRAWPTAPRPAWLSHSGDALSWTEMNIVQLFSDKMDIGLIGVHCCSIGRSDHHCGRSIQHHNICVTK